MNFELGKGAPKQVKQQAVSMTANILSFRVFVLTLLHDIFLDIGDSIRTFCK